MGVFMQMRNIFYINFCIVLIVMLPGRGPGSVLCVIRERHVVLKAVLHSRLYSCLAAAS